MFRFGDLDFDGDWGIDSVSFAASAGQFPVRFGLSEIQDIVADTALAVLDLDEDLPLLECNWEAE